MAPCHWGKPTVVGFLQLSFEALSVYSSAEDVPDQRFALQTTECYESSHTSVISTDLPPQ